MTSMLATTFVGLLWLLPIVILGGVVRIARTRYHRKDRRNPLSKGMLRGPGHSLKEQLVDLQWDLMTYIAITTPLPLFVFGIWSIHQLAFETPRLEWRWAILFGGAGVVFGAFKMVVLVKKIRNVRLGLEAETAIGQELDQLMKDGFSVYHDIPGDKAFNIDHVVVGPQGVFAVETKGRSKPVTSNEGEGHRVEYKDGRLIFPGWTEKAPLEQAKRNAEWLRKWLTSAVGASVSVKPVLMLPGWYIETKSRPNVAVMNGTNCRAYFARQPDEPLTDQLVRQIVHQLDTRCRDVEPRSYRPVRG